MILKIGGIREQSWTKQSNKRVNKNPHIVRIFWARGTFLALFGEWQF